MCVVYLLTAGHKVRKCGGRVEIQDRDHNKLYSLPICDVNNIVVASESQITYDVIRLALQNSIPIIYLDRRGKVIGTLKNERQGIEHLILQQKCFNHDEITLKLAKIVLSEKMQAQEKIMSDYARTMGKPMLKDIAKTISTYRNKVYVIDKIDELRGLEGISSRVYFSGFGEILDGKWNWNGRNRRPPLDPVNSLLSYGYAFLEGEVRIGIAGANLDERIGFLHSNNGRKDSLVYDLMEMFRQPVIDKFTFMLLNKHFFHPIDFYYDEEDGCRMTEVVRKKWIGYYEEYMTKERKMLNGLSWRKYIFRQIENFAETIWKLQP